MEKIDYQKLFTLFAKESGDPEGFSIRERASEAVPHTPIIEELKKRFDRLVDMNENCKVQKGTSVATFGLGGCIGGYIDNPQTSTFFHYDPFGVPIIDTLVRQDVTPETSHVHFIVPGGEWGYDANGKYLQKPKNGYVDQKLAATIRHVQSIGVNCSVHCYKENPGAGGGYMSRYQGTAWIDAQGKLSVEGVPVKISMRPKSDAIVQSTPVTGIPPRPV